MRLKVTARRPAPTGREASVVAIPDKCVPPPQNEGPYIIKGEADLDRGEQDIDVVTTGSQQFPVELKDSRTLTVRLSVTTRSCDCTWVPVVVWWQNSNLHETEILADGTRFRTVASTEQGLWRYAWVKCPVRKENGTRLDWVRVPFKDPVCPAPRTG